MPQGLMLLKELPDEGYLHDLQERGVLRASMNFLPGGCYAGAGLFDATASYAMSGTATAESMCPNPMDTAGCLLWEVMDSVRKVSVVRPSDVNAFLFLEVARGAQGAFAERVREVSGDDEGPRETESGFEYVASAALLGCGAYNQVVEVLASDHRRMQELVFALTDLPDVRQYALGRVRAEDTRGFGEGMEEGRG